MTSLALFRFPVQPRSAGCRLGVDRGRAPVAVARLTSSSPSEASAGGHAVPSGQNLWATGDGRIPSASLVHCFQDAVGGSSLPGAPESVGNEPQRRRRASRSLTITYWSELRLSPSAQVALVRGPDARTIRLVPGASLDGWSVREIRGEEIDLEADGRAYKMTFVKHTNRSGSNDPLTSAPNRQVGLQLLPTQVRFR